ncbi:MAG: HD domain-containing protein [Nitrososphaerota archaeon]|jgi:HD superfamily phosphohydrolase|nr:HD domain-containing protein [Nitrososphaerota archaeon]
MFKLFKDPLYGYIKISNTVVKDIIDTPVFQRLRRIVQTSYSPLYPSAGHNRFEHSIGVYHLGNIAGTALTHEIERDCTIKDLADWENINKIFLLACLLHDVGHAPFSHTGEKFYLDETAGKAYATLHKELIKLVGSENFEADVPTTDSTSAAPHELMSAIVGLRNFSDWFPTPLDKEIFTRCITGYKFSKKDDIHCLFNCYVTLLNSNIIDVDRLDYIMRDAFFTGFDTVNIDYVRLLSHITITNETDDNTYELAYRKGAISVIENFVYAHDSERKWIQNHPSILYDIYIIQHIISDLDKKLSTADEKLFSLETLSEAGQKLRNNIKLSLLCDDDIISLMKMYCLDEDELSKEYFSRKDRRRTLWKNEAEYKAFFLGKISSGDVLDDLEKALENTEKYLRKSSDGWIINDRTIMKLTQEIEEIKAYSQSGKVTKDNPEFNESIQSQMDTKQPVLKVMACLQSYAQSKGELCDFIILKADQFYSGFNKVDFSNITIVFSHKDEIKPKKFPKVVNSLSSGNNSRKDYFYIFYKKSVAEKFDKKEIRERLISAFL